MLNKTKAAMPGRQCYYTKLVRSQNSTLAELINRCCIEGNGSTFFFFQFCELLVIDGEASHLHFFLESGDFSLSESVVSQAQQEAPNHPNYLPSSCYSRKLYHTAVIHALGKDLGHISFLSHKFRTYNKNALCDLFSLSYSLSHPFGSMPRCCSSLRSIRLIQVARDESPSLRISSSSCERNSSLNRIWYCGDFFNSCIDTCNYPSYHLNVTTRVITFELKSNASECGNTAEASHQTVIRGNDHG